MSRAQEIESRLKSLDEAERRLKTGRDRTNVSTAHIDTERQKLSIELGKLKVEAPEPAPTARRGLRDRQ